MSNKGLKLKYELKNGDETISRHFSFRAAVLALRETWAHPEWYHGTILVDLSDGSRADEEDIQLALFNADHRGSLEN